MDGWTLIRRTAGYKTPSGEGWVEMRSPAAIYWARRTGETLWVPDPNGGGHRDDAVEIRSPVNAAYYGSEDEGEMLAPEASARSGVLPFSKVAELYAETTPEELGLTVVSKV